MTNTEELCEKAAAYFLEGYNCAQAVLLTLSEHMGEKNELIPKIASGFGGGIGRCGSVCGALAGSVMAVGIKFGTNERGVQKRALAYENSCRLYKQFEKQYSSVMCRDLINCDLSNPEEQARARREKIFETKCSCFVKTAVQNFLNLEER